jgi:hypothetical protein
VRYPGYEPPHVIKEIIPVHDVEVKVRIPGNKKIKSAYIAPGRKPIKRKEKAEAYCFVFDKIEINSILALEFGE